MLGQRVDGVHLPRDEPGNRGRDDDRSAAPVLQRLYRRTQTEDDAVDVGPHGPAVGVRRQGGDVEGRKVTPGRGIGRHAGVEMEQIEPAVVPDDPGNDACPGVPVADVETRELAADRVRDVASRGFVDVRDDDMGALGGKRLAGGPADSGGPAGDKADLLV